MAVPSDILKSAQPLDYEDLRDSIQNGDILLFSGAELFSLAIRWATKSPWSHVGFIFKLPNVDRIMVLQSVSGAGASTVALSAIVNGCGSNPKPYTGRLLVARHADFATLVTDGKLRTMSKFAVDRFGSPYSIAEILKIMLRIGAGWLNIKMPPLLQPDDEYICSEYAEVCYESIGIEIQWNGLGFIAPADFARDPRVSAVGVIKTGG